MSWIEDAINKAEKMMRERGPTFEQRLKYLEALSVEENERIVRERLESGWKDELRALLGPFDEALQRGEAVEALSVLLSDLVAELIRHRVRDAVSHHYLFQEVKLLKERLAKLEASMSKR